MRRHCRTQGVDPVLQCAPTGCKGSMGRQQHGQTAAFSACRASTMVHTAGPPPHKQHIGYSMGQHASSTCSSQDRHLQGAHPGACARRASRGVCQQLWGAGARGPPLYNLSFQLRRRLSGGSHMVAGRALFSTGDACWRTWSNHWRAALRAAGAPLGGRSYAAPSTQLHSQCCGVCCGVCCTCGACSTPLNTAPPTAWAAATAVGAALTAVTAPLPAPPPGGRAHCMVHIF
jgi:hypothetical protein